jgi:phosphatidylglycerol:prolipoprotein diacylglycerol transferase
MINGFTILGYKIYFYGIILMLGAVAAAFLSTYEAKRRGWNPDVVWDMLPWALIGGILGARLWHIFTPPASMVEQGITTMYYFTHPLQMLNFRNGGLGIPGAVMGGALAVYIYARKNKQGFAAWADIVAPGLALAQAIGRWGNFFNQEVYGAPSNLPWAIFIDPAHRLTEYINIERYHPLFLYESIWNSLNMALLLFLGRRKPGLKTGSLFAIYMMVYPLGRFLLEFLRLDISPVAGININQVTMAVIFVIGLLILLWLNVIQPRMQRKPVEPVSEG